MLALTDDQLRIVQNFAEPLDPDQRGAYLHRVVAILRDQEIGDGALHRACSQAQAEYRRLPAALDGRGHHGGKHGR
jgi:hypothetical protein